MKIVLECDPDEVLAKALGRTRKEITHQPNKGEVFNFLKKNPGLLGIVDEDPNSAQPDYFSNFVKQEEKFGVSFYTIPNNKTALIVIKPRLEEWILKEAKDCSIDPTSFSLPTKGSHLHRIINYQLRQFDEFIQALLLSKSPGLTYIKSLMQKSSKL